MSDEKQSQKLPLLLLWLCICVVGTWPSADKTSPLCLYSKFQKQSITQMALNNATKKSEIKSIYSHENRLWKERGLPQIIISKPPIFHQNTTLPWEKPACCWPCFQICAYGSEFQHLHQDPRNPTLCMFLQMFTSPPPSGTQDLWIRLAGRWFFFFFFF